MPFFRAAPQVHPELSLFHLLSTLDEPQHQVKQCRPVAQSFVPKFDIIESETAYELFGEVAGLEQQDLEVEFEDAQTLSLKGKVARPTAATTSPVQRPHVEEKESHNAYVEDEYDEADAPLSTPSVSSEGTVAEEEEKVPSPANKFKYWLAERKVGTFSRSFSFAQRVEHDAVAARLRNGILHVTVPKSGKAKKVVVSVN